MNFPVGWSVNPSRTNVKCSIIVVKIAGFLELFATDQDMGSGFLGKISNRYGRANILIKRKGKRRFWPNQ